MFILKAKEMAKNILEINPIDNNSELLHLCDGASCESSSIKWHHSS
jgi:hypothetical protein